MLPTLLPRARPVLAKPARMSTLAAFVTALPLRGMTCALTSLCGLVARLLLRTQARRRAHVPRRAGPTAAALPRGRDALVSVGGGGIFFFWQLGAARALMLGADAARVEWAGSSAGALVAALTLCEVPPHKAVALAAALAEDAGVYDRPAGLAGVWGALIRRWLDELLPANAADLCSGRVAVHVTVASGPWRGDLGVARVRHFATRDDLIAALMASVHIPWFLDGRLWGSVEIDGRKLPAMDGSILKFLPARKWFWGVRDADVKITSEEGRRPDYFITHMDDAEYMNAGPGFTELLSLDTAFAMVDRGFEFTKHRLEDMVQNSVQS